MLNYLNPVAASFAVDLSVTLLGPLVRSLTLVILLNVFSVRWASKT